ncbi:nuclear transport factor 2 family protein [Mycobacterium sp. 94-17]|uniref:nuclear transport factor 2 family protein n=1 Tax=Mycobacterium sp. 94-17 TaxID=2986147 RepID=UPI003B63990F
MCCNDGMSYQEVAADIEAIKQVKYRYLRAMDTKHWDDFADTMTEDIVGAYGSSLGKELHFDNRSDLVEYLSSAMGPGVVTEHRVTHPEITVTGDTASATWYLQDRVIVAEYNFMLIGAAFYHDKYRRTADGWRICGTGYDRTYEATMSVADLKFNVKPGRARADYDEVTATS